MPRNSHRLGLLLLSVASVCPTADAPAAHLIGPDRCALCHPDIAAHQRQTAMAGTWQGRFTTWLPPAFRASATDDLAYELKRTFEAFTYTVGFGGAPLNLPVTVLMRGRRHGLGFLASIRDLDGTRLARPTLVQARYEWSPEQNQLLLAPGCVRAKPQTLDAALGVVLSPTFEPRCFSCHGQPGNLGSGKEGASVVKVATAPGPVIFGRERWPPQAGHRQS